MVLDQGFWSWSVYDDWADRFRKFVSEVSAILTILDFCRKDDMQ